eukprot:10057563-Ditylum_brightwellii.AAC.1
MVNPSFATFWANNVPKYASEDEKAYVTVWFGALQSQPLSNNNNGTALPTATAPPSSLLSLRDDKLHHSSCPPAMSSSFPFQN